MAVMKIILTAIVGFCMVTFTGAFPQNSLETTSLPPLEPGCHYEDIEFTEVVEDEILEKQCHDVNKCVCKDKTEERCLTYKVDAAICKDTSEKECKDITKKVCDTITERDIKPYNTTICEPKTIEKCEYHWVCENEECYIKRWDKNPDTCKPFTITECKTVLLNQTITRNVEIEKNITIQYCESVPKTKCEIAQVDKTHCTTEVVEECLDTVEQECEEIHKKVPVSVTTIKPIKKCGPLEPGTTTTTTTTPTYSFNIRQT